MKIKYFGTCAAEGFPGMFCSCETCEKARKAGGKNIRTRSQSLIDSKILIDFPADTYMHVINYGLDLRDIKTCLITHSHEDHLYERDFYYRTYGFSYMKDESKKEPLHIYASDRSGMRIRSFLAGNRQDERDPNSIRVHTVKEYEPFEVEGYKITPIPADHDITTQPLNYIIEKDGKALFYAHDTGYFPDKTWKKLERLGICFDFVSLDCNNVLERGSTRNHLSLYMCTRVEERLKRIGCANDKTVFCINHFSHNGRLIHDELVPVAKEYGYEVAYDGAEFEF